VAAAVVVHGGGGGGGSSLRLRTGGSGCRGPVVHVAAATPLVAWCGGGGIFGLYFFYFISKCLPCVLEGGAPQSWMTTICVGHVVRPLFFAVRRL
jgi:hypothetical protein